VFVALALAVLLSPARAEPLTVFAAASLKNAFDAIALAFEDETGTEIVLSYAGTSALVRQIEQGAPADVFVSAHPAWMNFARENGLVDEGTVQIVARNTLVVIEPVSASASEPFDLRSADDWFGRLGERGRLAIGLTTAVPAGIYAWQALGELGIDQPLRPRFAETDSVRAALVLVARAETPLGIVYATDAAAEPRVRTIASVPPETHLPIVYEAAQTSRASHEAADAFMAFLYSETAREALEAQGFLATDCAAYHRLGACGG
ncbi:MAG: molybdate ABC transporter substrate-binding protein, partial [Devosiaceae bacterium]|nr:molybdate ABC transporter substrate-binding protein [Devosiaceae bacterium MH13]